MRLKTQFLYLTAAIALIPVAFSAFLFGIWRLPTDQREATAALVRGLRESWEEDGSLSAESIGSAAREARRSIRELALVSPDGLVLYSTFSGMAAGEAVQIEDFASIRRTQRAKANLSVIRLDHSRADSPVLFLSLEPVDLRLLIRNRSLLIMGLVELCLLVVAGGFSFAILRSINGSIKRIERDTRIVAAGDLDYLVAEEGNDEMRSLASSVNHMRRSLKEMLSRQSRMLMGVSHDLKTPIALIQGYADALADGVAVDDETRSRYLGIIRDKAGRLEDLSAEIIEFLKLGQRDSGYRMVPEDPAELLCSIGSRYAADAELLERDFRWGFGPELAPEAPEALPAIPMNRSLVERALENLVDNAMRYSPRGGRVELRLEATPEGPVFAVRDDGPGVPPEDAPYVFDAFFRGSRARAGDGHGLGLTMAKAVAELHGWSVSLGGRADGLPGAEARLLVRGPSAWGEERL
ncbi:MAG: HAMP domain-containing sensor histidine kinase [Spirochaetaceae bacterium]|nr:HAMP domain-containing sensor histidine kinase [Spirochaetaceae bacterium]